MKDRLKAYSLFFALVLLMIALITLSIPQETSANESSGGWSFSITPYIWLPDVDGTFRYDLPSDEGDNAEVRVGPVDYLEKLHMALMLAGDARKGRLLMLTDVVYLNFQSVDSYVKSVEFDVGRRKIGTSLDTDTKSSLEGVVWNLAGGYAVIQDKSLSMDVFGGFRYFGLEASTEWDIDVTVTSPSGTQVFPRSGDVSRRQDVWDGIIGLRGKIDLWSSNFFVPYYVDIGTGTSDFTWQGVLGFGYRYKWLEFKADYRHLYYNQGSDSLFKDVTISGPGVVVTARF